MTSHGGQGGDSSSEEEDTEEEEEPGEVTIGKVQLESLKHMSSSNLEPTSKRTPTVTNGPTIHRSLEGTY